MAGIPAVLASPKRALLPWFQGSGRFFGVSLERDSEQIGREEPYQRAYQRTGWFGFGGIVQDRDANLFSIDLAGSDVLLLKEMDPWSLLLVSLPSFLSAILPRFGVLVAGVDTSGPAT